jgi:hypothetical protein
MPTRLEQAHLDVLHEADPEALGRWSQFWRKVGKTAYAAFDHEKGAMAASLVGTAASIGMGILTGGASLLIQFVVSAASGVAGKGGSSLINYYNYRRNKRVLQSLGDADPSKIGRPPRVALRAAREALEYNEEHFLTAMFKVTQAYIKLKKWEHTAQNMRAVGAGSIGQATAVTLSPSESRKLLSDMYNFYFEYDRALHYFTQFEIFVQYSQTFVRGQADWYNGNVRKWDAAAEATINAKSQWHTTSCRTALITKSICYGANSATATQRDGEPGGLPHKRII